MTGAPDTTARHHTPPRRRGRKRAIALAVLVLLSAGYYFNRRPAVVTQRTGTTAIVKRGPLAITVSEGGSIEALKSQEVKSDVRGETKILKIVDEGHIITQEEIDKNFVLVELDAEKFKDDRTERQLAYETAKAADVEAQKRYEIQVNDNDSAIAAAKLAVKFARMDFERYLGEKVAKEMIHALGLDSQDSEALAEAIAGSAKATDFSKYASTDKLGDGEARNNLRKYENEFMLSGEDVGLATTRLDGTQRLLDREFVTKNDFENDKIALERKKTTQEASKTTQELFIKYDFPKMAEKLLSDYVESLRKLDRAEKVATSQLAQAEANRNSAKVRFELQTMEREKIEKQIANCTIKASHLGMIVYGSQNQRWYSGDEIKEGASVRERQVIFTIPDTSVWCLKVKVHESYVKQIKPGQRASIRVESFPEEQITGEVQKINPLPDTENRWMNPDVKVYETTVVIEGAHDWMRPGLTAEAEILIEQIDDVLQVPIQAIHAEDEQQFCYVTRLGRSPERRPVKTGKNNEVFVQIAEGLSEDEVVLLKAPMDTKKKEGGKKNAEGESEKKPDGKAKDTGKNKAEKEEGAKQDEAKPNAEQTAPPKDEAKTSAKPEAEKANTKPEDVKPDAKPEEAKTSAKPEDSKPESAGGQTS